jgi:hypothetical protein
MSAPTTARLVRVPKAPFARPRLALTSGNRGSHDIIKKPNKNNKTFKQLSSLLAVMVFINK